MATSPRRTRAAQPSAIDIANAIAAASEEKGIQKHAPTIIVSILLALILWVGSTLLSLNNTVTRMSANVDGLAKSISDLQMSQGASSKALGDLQAPQAAERARNDAQDADANRMKERLRLLEGQRPLTGLDHNVAR